MLDPQVQNLLRPHLAELKGRALKAGGFASRPGSLNFRSDCSAWAAVALKAAYQTERLVDSSLQRLAAEQKGDGRVPISPRHPEAFWPTSLAVLAWHGSAGYARAQERAVEFLLSVKGRHFPKPPTSPQGHNTALQGWPWVTETHSWVEPTALGILSLSLTGRRLSVRAKEGIRLLLDRQLEAGGWNYGNTTVFGTALYPLPGTTGIALAALAGHVQASAVEKSLRYLGRELEHIRTPFSLAWGLLGLSAWRRRPPQSLNWTESSFRRQAQRPAYDTTSLALLIIAAVAPTGLLRLLSEARVFHHA